MPYLLDTSILGRLANKADAQHAVALQAVSVLRTRGESLCIVPQNLVEFRSFATRPVNVGGLGLRARSAETLIEEFESLFTLLPETADIYPAWKTLVRKTGTIGKQVHDARLVAACHVHAIGLLLTFNVQHFLALGRVAPGVIVVHPSAV
jgi:predicted nucleic acid-binding protein